MDELKCPLCGGPSDKVLYAGLPMRLCRNEECRCGWGLGSWLTFIFFNGYFFVYQGSYWKALWRWLTEESW